MEAPAPKVSVVIPNFNGITPRDGLVCLELVLSSLERQTFRDFDVTVVDDASTDSSVRYLETSWPQVRVVALEQNSGFPSVVNRGIAASGGEHIALINNDVELSPDWLEELVGELDRDAAIGFVTGKILSYADRDVIEQVGQDYYTCGRFTPRGLDERDAGQYEERRLIPIATAAASIYRRASVEQAGGFDEDYFLYCEDSDLCLRMLMAGFRGVYFPGTRAYHVRGATTGALPELVQFHLYRNGLITLVKDLPGPTLRRSLPKIVLYEAHQLRVASANGYGRVFLRAYRSFFKMLPGTLRKRRWVQGQRAISVEAFEEFLLTEYPLPSRLARLRARLRGRG
jgi:GT2 family glycosyltransferase